MRHYHGDASPAWFEAEHYDYDRRPWNVLHRRCVVALEDDVWVIVDDLLIEDRLNDEVRDIMSAHGDQIRRADVQFHEMFKVIKARLARERNIII